MGKRWILVLTVLNTLGVFVLILFAAHSTPRPVAPPPEPATRASGVWCPAEIDGRARLRSLFRAPDFEEAALVCFYSIKKASTK